MERERLERHSENIMVCKNCGERFKFSEVVSFLDSCELPGDLLWINGCKKCGGIHYDEIEKGCICIGEDS